MKTVQNGKGSKSRIDNFSKFRENFDEIDFTVPSPCISICKMSGGYCTGCKRSLSEIKNWKDLSNTEKKKVLNEIRLRR